MKLAPMSGLVTNWENAKTWSRSSRLVTSWSLRHNDVSSLTWLVRYSLRISFLLLATRSFFIKKEIAFFCAAWPMSAQYHAGPDARSKEPIARPDRPRTGPWTARTRLTLTDEELDCVLVLRSRPETRREGGAAEHTLGHLPRFLANRPHIYNGRDDPRCMSRSWRAGATAPTTRSSATWRSDSCSPGDRRRPPRSHGSSGCFPRAQTWGAASAKWWPAVRSVIWEMPASI